MRNLKMKVVGNLMSPRPGDAGFDLYCTQDYVINPGRNAVVRSGVKMEIPAGYVGIIRDRSSMAAKLLYVAGGVIDSGYRGEILIVIENRGPKSEKLTAGDRVAQMLIIPYVVPEIEYVDELSETERGEGGFGSTGE